MWQKYIVRSRTFPDFNWIKHLFVAWPRRKLHISVASDMIKVSRAVLNLFNGFYALLGFMENSDMSRNRLEIWNINHDILLSESFTVLWLYMLLLRCTGQFRCHMGHFMDSFLSLVTPPFTVVMLVKVH